MLTKNIVLYTATAIAIAALTGCATTTTPVDRHQHQRDAKQGATMPEAAAGATAPKLLHDHREWK